MFLAIIDAVVCSCLNEMDVRVGILICLIHTFSQSIIGAIYIYYPYIIVPSLGIFFSIFFIFQMKEIGKPNSLQLLLLFLSQEFISIYVLLYGLSENESILFMIIHSYFLVVSTLGVCFSYRLGEIIRQHSFISLSPSLNQV